MRGNYIIHDKASGNFWTGSEWHRQHSEARMYPHIADAVEVAKGLKDSVTGPIEVLNGYQYLNANVMWSSS